MQAEFVSFNIDINYRCPNCKLFFRLADKDIPTEKDLEYQCKECWEPITIPSMGVVVTPKKPDNHQSVYDLANKDASINKNYRLCIKAIMKYGWNKREAEDLVNSVWDQTGNQQVDVLVKLALANVGVDNE